VTLLDAFAVADGDFDGEAGVGFKLRVRIELQGLTKGVE
jgi:hypothetical protein